MNFRYSAAGFRQDQEVLFTRFSTPEPDPDGRPPTEISLRFTRFCQIWRGMNFSLIFRLRQNENDLREFVDEIYLEVLPFVGSEHAFPRRVFALYLLYSLFVKQPNIRQKIRINFQYLEEIRELIQKCKETEQLDVCFVWYKLLSLGAIDLVHVSRLMGPYFIRNLKVTNERLTETDLIIDNFRTSIYTPMNELSHIHEKYRLIKDCLMDRNPHNFKDCDKVVDNMFELFKAKSDNLHKEFFSNDLSQQSMSSLSSQLSQELSQESQESKSSSDIGTKRRRLKEKASSFGTQIREQVIEESEQKRKKRPKPLRGRPKVAKLTEVQ